MRIVTGTANIFDIKCDAVCVTTNGIVKSNGEAVMGAGIAKEADARYNLAASLGKNLHMNGNHCYHMGSYDDKDIITFPTKNHWKDDSSLELIIQSCKELVSLTDVCGYSTVYLPPVGCGCGKLDWNTVEQAISPYLDDRFVIYMRNKPNTYERR